MGISEGNPTTSDSNTSCPEDLCFVFHLYMALGQKRGKQSRFPKGSISESALFRVPPCNVTLSATSLAMQRGLFTGTSFTAESVSALLVLQANFLAAFEIWGRLWDKTIFPVALIATYHFWSRFFPFQLGQSLSHHIIPIFPQYCHFLEHACCFCLFFSGIVCECPLFYAQVDCLWKWIVHSGILVNSYWFILLSTGLGIHFTLKVNATRSLWYWYGSCYDISEYFPKWPVKNMWLFLPDLNISSKTGEEYSWWKRKKNCKVGL